MRYSRLLEAVFGSRARVALVRTLARAPEKEWGSRELARFAGCSHTAAQRSLRAFAELNLVRLSRQGNVQVVRLNRESWAYQRLVKPAVEAEDSARRELAELLRGAFGKRGVACVALFGSVAARVEEAGSDVDVLVVTERKEAAERAAAVAGAAVAARFGNELAVTVLTPREFKRKERLPFLVEARRRHEMVWGDWP